MPRQAFALLRTILVLTLRMRQAIRTGFGRGRFPGPPITPRRSHPRSLDTGNRYHIHHSSHSRFVSGRYTLELSSDPSGLRRTVPSAPVLPCTPALFRDVSAGLCVVKGSTVARSPSVRVVTHIFVGRVSRFRGACRFPGWPVPMSPKSLSCVRPSIIALETIDDPEWGRREYYNSQRPVVAAPARFHARGFSSLFSWLRENVEPSGSLASCRGGGSPRHGSVTAGGHPVWQYTSVNAYSD